MFELTPWDSFFVIIGSAAGGLIGLQFVVMTLLADRPLPGADNAGPAFATPTVVHFSAVLFLSAILRAPWPSIVPVASVWGLVGVGGTLYTGIVTRRMRSQSAYKPGTEDWSFHAVLPFTAYVALAATALGVAYHPKGVLFGVAGAGLLLLFSGIHNAWDAVAYHVMTNIGRSKDERHPGAGERRP
jgi:hypothetical protein